MRAIFAMTAGIGSVAWRDRARQAAASWERYAQTPCLVLYDLPSLCGALGHVMWLKYWLWDFAPSDAEIAVWIDADAVVRKPLVLPRFTGLAGVLDAEHSAAIARRAMPRLGDAPYYNTGVIFADRASKPVFALMQGYARAGCRDTFIEQSYYNLAAQQCRVPICELPRAYNWLTRAWGPPPDDVVITHDAGRKQD
jgi:hypothetical protein